MSFTIVSQVDLTKGIVSEKFNMTLDIILNEVSEFTGLSIDKIKMINRKRELTDARCLFMRFAFLNASYSVNVIAEFVNLRYPSVTNAEKKCRFVLFNEFEEFSEIMHSKYNIKKKIRKLKY